MKCACGYRKFRETVRTTQEAAERWVFFTPGEEGFGEAPFGTLFGGGGFSYWGLFSLNVEQPKRFLNCESCGRTRSATPTGGFGVFGAYHVGGYVYLVVTDASLLTCARVRFTQGSTQHTVEVAPYLGLPLPLEMPMPEVVSETLPSGILAGVIRAEPPTGLTGSYVVSLVDICASTETALFTDVFNT
jgi:hypothetical protein